MTSQWKKKILQQKTLTSIYKHKFGLTTTRSSSPKYRILDIKSWCSNNKIFGGDYEILTLRLNGYFLITLATFSPFLECIVVRKLLDRQQRDSDHRWPCVAGFSLQSLSVYLCARLLGNSQWDIIQQCAASFVSVVTCMLQAVYCKSALHVIKVFCRRLLTLLHCK